MEVRCSTSGNITQHATMLQDGREEMVICVENIDSNSRDDIVIEADFKFPILDIAGKWHPMCRFDRALKADWGYGEKSMSAISAPIVTFFSENGRNRGTFAVSETQREVRMNLGVHEEDGTMNCRIRIHLGKTNQKSYTVRVLSDYRDIRYEKAIGAVETWWEEKCNLKAAYVPADARNPMYSFWYSYHQEFTDIEIEEECKRAKEMGFKTVIVDDGWQTDDTNRGYGYCGEWKPAETKIKDMKQHVARIHKLGMKYLLWFSVPYVGMYSKIWPQVKDKLIAVDEEQKTGILDIRYPEIRKYLKETYLYAVKEWGLDGVKLDFIDEFYPRENTPRPNEKMDCECLQEALHKLLQETTEAFALCREDLLIEFRQRYIGPSIRKFGNIFRVGDCPNSGISNRVGITDLRLLSGNTAVHSDMLMWNRDEKPEVAAIQIIDCLFGTLQFSVRLDQMNEMQKQMVRNYLMFMRRHKKVLQESEFMAKEPQNLYPEIRAYNAEEEIIACYSEGSVIEMNPDLKNCIIVNGTKSEKMYVEAKERVYTEIQIYDCCGGIAAEMEHMTEGIQSIRCPIGGRIEMKRR